jgi:hypothetical protein
MENSKSDPDVKCETHTAAHNQINPHNSTDNTSTTLCLEVDST